MKHRLVALLGLFLLASADTLDARIMRSWTYHELLDKSDLVVMATPTATKDTDELTSLPDMPGVRVAGVETRFAVSAVLKGDQGLKDFILHHYRETKSPELSINGPLLVAFDPARSRPSLLFLAREADGRYAPTTGQTDPAFQAVHVLGGTSGGTATSAASEPGPEDGGLRLRLAVAPRAGTGKEGFDVRLDLLNTSTRAITLRAGWRHDDAGDLKDYLDAATSVECVPAILRWRGGVQGGQRKLPQPEHVLEAGAVLSVRWQTEGRHLKNRVTNPNEVQNPEFPFPGLYSVHATVNVITSERTVPLRSNEQLVPVGGSRAIPKYSLGQLERVEADGKTAMVSLGSRHKIEPGDQFEHRSKIEHWKLTITKVEPDYSRGNLELIFPASPKSPLPGMELTLIRKK